MVSLRASAVDAPDAHALLAEYFAARAAGFPGATYRTTFPAPEAFEPPAGVFVVVEDDERTPVGCGGIRSIADGPHGPSATRSSTSICARRRGGGAGGGC